MSAGMVKIELVGCLRYGYKGDKYEQNVHYMVKADRAKLLLRLTTDYGYHVFKEVGKAFQPVATKAPAPERVLPVVDTTKTEEQQYDEQLTASAEAIVDEAKPVVVVGADKEPDISEEEAEVILEEAEEEEVEEEGTPV